MKKSTIRPYVRKVSKKRAKENREYAKVRKEYLEENPNCEANLAGCSYVATDIHHMKGRCGSLLTDVRHFRALCRNCHCFIEENPLEAKLMGFSKSRLAI